MSANEVELQPDVDTVLQVEEPYGDQHVVKVEVCAPVRTQRLPTKAATAFTKLSVGTFTDPRGQQRLLRADHRRARATIIGVSDFWMAFSQANAGQNTTCVFCPGKVPIIVEAVTDIFVSSTAGFVDISCMTESWATGEGVE